MPDDNRAPPMTLSDHVEWFHGSPERLGSLRTGSTVTPVVALAKAFSHKPSELRIEINEDTDTGERRVRITHNGTRNGYLYRVLTQDPTRDFEQHPGSSGAAGEEVLTTRELPIEFVQELPVCATYEFTEATR